MWQFRFVLSILLWFWKFGFVSEARQEQSSVILLMSVIVLAYDIFGKLVSGLNASSWFLTMDKIRWMVLNSITDILNILLI